MLQTMELLMENITGEMDLTEEKLIISSDGSHFQNKSGGVYIIAHENGDILLTENITGEMDITEENLIISSDGSHFQNKSDGAYIIAHTNRDILAKGSNPDTDDTTYQQSYRSEAQAKLAGHLCVHHLCKYYQIKQPTTISSCDNQGLRTKLVAPNTKIQCKDKDIVSEIKKLTDHRNTFTHAHGHQDEKV